MRGVGEYGHFDHEPVPQKDLEEAMVAGGNAPGERELLRGGGGGRVLTTPGERLVFLAGRAAAPRTAWACCLPPAKKR